MKRIVMWCVLAGCVLAAAPAAAADAEDGFVCTPCGMSCDETVHAEPGTCPVCGQPLVSRAAAAEMQAAQAARRRTAAILLFDGVQIIDFTGPYEVLGQAGFDVVTVARDAAPVTTAMDMRVTPEHTFDDAPMPDVLVVPGGDVHGAEADGATLDWIRRTAEHARYTMSVCNGAFILAKAGLLDGKSATTFYGLIDALKEAAGDTKVVRDQRFVDNGRIITTAGLSSGIDGTLHVIERMYGHGRAQEIALHMEYDWQPESGFARAALADLNVPNLRIEGVVDRTLSTDGSRDAWEKTWRLESDLPLAELATRVNACFASSWTPKGAPSARADGPVRSDWRFVDRDGDRWRGSLTLAPAGEQGFYELHVSIARAS